MKAALALPTPLGPLAVIQAKAGTVSRMAAGQGCSGARR